MESHDLTIVHQPAAAAVAAVAVTCFMLHNAAFPHGVTTVNCAGSHRLSAGALFALAVLGANSAVLPLPG